MSARSQTILPEPLKQALELRQTVVKCRTDVEAALTKYGLIRTAGVGMAAPRPSLPPPPPANRFTNLGSSAAPDGWRTKSTPRHDEEDRWSTAHNSKKRGIGNHSGSSHSGSSHGGSSHSGSSHGGSSHSGSSHSGSSHSGSSHSGSSHSGSSHSGSNGSSSGMSNFRRSERTTDRPEYSREGGNKSREIPIAGGAGGAVCEPSAGAWRSSRFQPLEETIVNESMDDRIMGKVRAKVNKLGNSTYDATKSFMKQILDSGETDFLNEFMRFVFGKAATEPAFCGLYARFLHELADEFPHLREAMVCKFREYTRVFDEASKAPDVGTTDYKAFVEAQEQKKFRRGYSQFVSELAKIGEVSMEDFRLLVNRVVETIQVCYLNEENRTMCEEVIDCFMVMVRAAKVDWMREYVDILRSVANAPKDAAPGLSNKGRFAVMDILDLVTKRR